MLKSKFRKLIDVIAITIFSILAYGMIIWGLTMAIIKVVMWTQETLPVFKDEQAMAGVFIWIYAFVNINRYFDSKHKD